MHTGAATYAAHCGWAGQLYKTTCVVYTNELGSSSSSSSTDMEEVLDTDAEAEAQLLFNEQQEECFRKGVKLNNLTLVAKMIQEGFGVNTVLDGYHRTGLHLATSCGLLDMVTLLLDENADALAWNMMGDSALMETVSEPKSISLEIIGVFAAKLAGHQPHPIPLNSKHLLNRGGETLLMRACCHGSTEMIKLLLDRGFDPSAVDAKHCNSLHHLAKRSHCDESFDVASAVSMLSEAAPPPPPPNTRLVDVKNAAGNTPLHIASMYTAYPNPVPVLLAHGANVSHTNAQGQTPLHLAAHSATAETVEYLCAAGARVEARDSQGRAPIHMVFESNRKRHPKPNTAELKEVLNLLINSLDRVPVSVYLNMRDDRGSTPLHLVCRYPLAYSCETSCIIVLRHLLAYPRIDADAQDINGDTPLHLCARLQSGTLGYRSIKTLLRHGVRIHLRNLSNETAQTILAERHLNNYNFSNYDMYHLLDHRYAQAEERSIAFAMGHHANLGSDSILRYITPETLQMILDRV